VPLRNYFVPTYEAFSIFPWGAFLAFGIARRKHDSSGAPHRMESRVMQWSSLCGFGLLLGGQYFSNLPFSIYPASEFWLNSPGLIFCKLGGSRCCWATGAYLWTEFLATGWSFVRQLGTTSLVVYWAHIELTYGRWFADYRQKLDLGIAFAIVLGNGGPDDRGQRRIPAHSLAPDPANHRMAHARSQPRVRSRERLYASGRITRRMPKLAEQHAAADNNKAFTEPPRATAADIMSAIEPRPQGAV